MGSRIHVVGPLLDLMHALPLSVLETVNQDITTTCINTM